MDKRVRLVLLSFLMLFVELSLIRWLGSDVFYLSYFSNFVLLGSFLGIGIGFLAARMPIALFGFAPLVLAAMVAFVLKFPVTIDRSGSALIFFGGELKPTGLPSWILLPLVFLAVASVMAMIAQGVARTFVEFPALEAYRLDILGSLLGILAFTALSSFSAPPLGWGVVVAALFLALTLPAPEPVGVVGMAMLVILLGWESTRPNLLWSPYYKIAIQTVVPGPTVILVNGVPHQAIEPVSLRRQLEPIYFRPYELAPKQGPDVLVVGAGNGTDTAIALAQGARHVDAVEIDPRIYELGRHLNPDHPYSDPRVTVHVDDARAFLEQNHTRYDLVLFALPDSITLIPGQSSLRLESYLFTTEAMRSARDHLKPDGVFAQYNYYREQWLLDRYATMLTEAYGHAPCVETIGSGSSRFSLLAESPDPTVVRCETHWAASTDFGHDAVTDDHPFPYLRYPSIPATYLLALGMILVASLVTVRGFTGPLRQMLPYTDLFAMGAAFLLLETKNVVQFALLFGTTWRVNALVFGGILLAVLLAVEVTRRTALPRLEALYGLLFASLAVAMVVPPELLLKLSFAPRLAAAVAVAFFPVFVANLIFAGRFREVGSSTIAFGANLLGAMCGGVLEYASLVVGYRALLLVVAALYLVALVLERAHRTDRRSAVAG